MRQPDHSPRKPSILSQSSCFQRFKGFEFRASDYLREEYFDLKDYIQEINQVFVRWGRKKVERLNSDTLRPEDTPPYLVQYHTQHLLNAAAPAEAFLELVEHG